MFAKHASKLFFARHAALALALAAGTTTAQSFGGKVAVDPKAGTATYDFHFEGPPRGFAALYVSPAMLRQPWHLRGIGDWELDPLGLFPLGVLPMGPTGKTDLRLTLPLQLVERGLCIQPLYFDTQSVLRLVPGLGFDAGIGFDRQDGPLSTYAGSWSRTDGRYSFAIGSVRQGDNLSIAVDNRPVFATRAKATGRLAGSFLHPNPFRHGSRIDVYKNGKIWLRIRR